MSTNNTCKAMERYLAALADRCACEACPADSALYQGYELARQEMVAENARAKTTGVVRKILVALDREDHAALTAALDIAEPLAAEVAIVYVLEPHLPLNTESAYVYTQTPEQRRAGALALLQNIQAALPQNAHAFTVLREGKAATEIVAAASEFDADMIVIGTHKRGVLARFFLGSVSQEVFRRAHCPVMLVTDTTGQPPTPPAVRDQKTSPSRAHHPQPA